MSIPDVVAKYAMENKRLRDVVARAEADRLALEAECLRLDAQANDLRQTVATLTDCLGSEQRARRALLSQIEKAKIPPPPPATEAPRVVPVPTPRTPVEPPPSPPGPLEDCGRECNCDVMFFKT